MKDAPEIAPEVRGLIEEIVANPRSSLRLVPKRALLPWIEKGERASVRELSSDAAVRHLLAAHREAVARLLREAAHIAYWKAPVMSHKPVGADGKQYDPAQAEGGWRTRAQSRVVGGHMDEGIEMLRQCLTSIRPDRVAELARASLSLTEDDMTSFTLAESAKGKEPRTALRIFERIGKRSGGGALQWMAWGGVGSCYCSRSEFHEAVLSYQRATAGWPYAWFSVFNLALLLQRPALALEASHAIEAHWAANSFQVEETRILLSSWARGLSKDLLNSIQTTIGGLSDRLPEAAHTVGLAYA